MPMMVSPHDLYVPLEELLLDLDIPLRYRPYFLDHLIDSEGISLIVDFPAVTPDLSAEAAQLHTLLLNGPGFRHYTEGCYVDDDRQQGFYGIFHYALSPQLAHRYFKTSTPSSSDLEISSLTSSQRGITPPSGRSRSLSISSGSLRSLRTPDSPRSSNSPKPSSSSSSTRAHSPLGELSQELPIMLSQPLAIPNVKAATNEGDSWPAERSHSPCRSSSPAPRLIFEDVQLAAYYLAEHSGFQRDPESCWYEAEAQLRRQRS